MKKFALLAFGTAFFASNVVIMAAQASSAMAPATDNANRVAIVAHGSHTDCQDDGKGSHFHRGMKSKRVSCPGGKK